MEFIMEESFTDKVMRVFVWLILLPTGCAMAWWGLFKVARFLWAVQVIGTGLKKENVQ